MTGTTQERLREQERPAIPQTPTEPRSGRILALGAGVLALAVATTMLVTGVRNAPEPAPAGPGPSAEAASSPVTSITRRPEEVGQPVRGRAPQTVSLELTTQEVEGRLADGTSYRYWTFNGMVPGPMLRVRVGDRVQLRIRNSADSTQPHSVDLHAVTGPGGGGAATQVPPGQERTITFQALNPGVYVYHCATPHIPTHLANGMYGLIVVEPEGGLPPVDREFYVMQGEIYTNAPRGTSGLVGYDAEAMDAERPTYVVFNGAVGGLTGDAAMHAKVGERIRMFVGNGGPNLVSNFHVIGEIFDEVHDEGATEPKRNVQTTLIPAGGATWVEFTVQVPGNYMLVDHAIARAIDKGALAVIQVEGPGNPTVFDAPPPPPMAEDAHMAAPPAAQDEVIAPGTPIELSMAEFHFMPAKLTLQAGRHTFRIRNDGAVPHEFTISPASNHNSYLARSKQLGAGGSQELTVNLKPGTYEIACHVPGHYEAGMRGTLTVQ